MDVSEWITGDIIFNCWDFAGQAIFYPTHQFFLSGRSVYVITFNLLEPNPTKIEYWLHQIDIISAYLSYVIIVGTHADNEKCTDDYIFRTIATLKNKFQRKFPFIQEYFTTRVDDKSSYSLISSYLCNKLIKKHRILKTLIPGSWEAVANIILHEKSKGIQIITKKEYHRFCYQFGVQLNQYDLLKEFLHDVGILISLPEFGEKSVIVINPKWLSDVMTCVITLKHKWINNGILLQNNWQHIWNSFPSNIHSQLFHILEIFEVAHTLRGDPPRCLIPSLLPDEIPNHLLNEHWPTISFWKIPKIKNNGTSCKGIYRYGRIWKFSFLPVGIFSRVLVRILHIKEISIICMWRYGILMKYHKQKALLIYSENEYKFELQIRTIKSGLPVIMRWTLDSVNSLLDTLYSLRADQKKIYIPCIHCYQEKSNQIDKAFLFSLDDIVLAISRGSPFVFCNHLSNRKIRIDTLAPDITFGGIPTISSDSFEIGEKIARGGFGTVYKGKLLSNNNQNSIPVAIKELSLIQDDEIVEVFSNFQREVQIMSCLDHPNLVKLIGVSSLAFPMYMIMEYVSGGTLYDLLHSDISDDDLDWALRIRLALDIAQGMYYLHSTTPAFIHRDLRSPNILVSKNPIFFSIH